MPFKPALMYLRCTLVSCEKTVVVWRVKVDLLLSQGGSNRGEICLAGLEMVSQHRVAHYFTQQCCCHSSYSSEMLT